MSYSIANAVVREPRRPFLASKSLVAGGPGREHREGGERYACCSMRVSCARVVTFDPPTSRKSRK